MEKLKQSFDERIQHQTITFEKNLKHEKNLILALKARYNELY